MNILIETARYKFKFIIILQGAFDYAAVPIPMEMTEMYDKMSRHQSRLSSPPAETLVKCREFLVSLKSSDAIYTFLQEKNEAINCLLSENSRDRVESFTKLVWFDSLLSVESCIDEKPDDIVVVINRQGFTEVKSSLHSFFISSDFYRYVCSIFDVTQCTPAQRAVAIELATLVHF